MPRLRAVLVMVPPLLRDLIRHALTSRVEVSIVADIAEAKGACRQLRDLAPDIVIVGPAGASSRLTAELVRSLLPHAQVLALSADLTTLLGPGEDDRSEFTPDTLADRVRRYPGAGTI